MARKPKRALYKLGGLYLIDRGGYYHIIGFHSGKRYRKSTGVSDLDEAAVILDDFVEELDYRRKPGRDEAGKGWRGMASAMCSRHKASAIVRQIFFDLKPLDVFLEMERNNFQCAVSGIPFSRDRGSHGAFNPWAPSIDRIVSGHGYTKDNIRVVCVAANLAMNSYGFDVLLRLSRAIVRREGRGEFLAREEHSEPQNAHKSLMLLKALDDDTSSYGTLFNGDTRRKPKECLGSSCQIGQNETE